MIIPPYCPLMSQSNDEFDRAVLRPHAQECRAQQMLRHMRTIRGRHARFLAQQSSQEVEPLHPNSVTDNFRVISPKDFRVLT